MRRYTKLIVLSVVLVLLIASITLTMIFDIDFMLFNNLSISTIQARELNADEMLENLNKEELNNTNAKQSLETSKKSYEKEKNTYENIDESTIEIVEDATKEEKYFIEYLWIVLGNYANSNGVDIGIVTPGATTESSSTNTNTNTNTNAGANFGQGVGSNTSTSTSTNTSKTGIKIAIEGRYANVADFIFDVENDKSLRFKLDNIQMTYVGNNEIKAQFDILSLSVLK